MAPILLLFQKASEDVVLSLGPGTLNRDGADQVISLCSCCHGGRVGFYGFYIVDFLMLQATQSHLYVS